MSGNRPTTEILRNDVVWDSLDAEGMIAVRDAVDARRSSSAAQALTGRPDDGARIEEHVLALPGRRLRVRIHRPVEAGPRLPLVLSFHGGGFVMGTTAQNDWLNSTVAARVHALVVSVEYRLAPEHPLPAPVKDALDTLRHLLGDPDRWGIDPGSVSLLGESAGGTIAALVAQHARAHGPRILAQVLTCPVTDWTATMTDHPSMVTNADRPGLSLPQLRACRRFAVPATLDPRESSPLMSDDLADLPATLVVVGELDPAADHGRRYVDRLVAAGTEARLHAHEDAVHAFLSMPGLVDAARPASQEIVEFLRRHLPVGAAGAGDRPGPRTRR
ncbi:MAG: alpha/beta hydrolase [Actinomycetaceae bacterium]